MSVGLKFAGKDLLLDRARKQCLIAHPVMIVGVIGDVTSLRRLFAHQLGF